MSHVHIDHVTKRFGGNLVLDRMSLKIEEGELITLLGPSGCGKSTLLRGIAGLVAMDEGKIVISGRDVTQLPPMSRNVGMVFQSYALFPNMNVFHNIAFGLKMEGLRMGQIQPLVHEMLELMDLQDKKDLFPHQCSGGQQQRVALARALVKKPNILLLDEPLSALDAKIRRSLRSEIRRIQRQLNMTTIFVTHDQEEALTISDRIYIMNHGRIEQEGTPEEIYTAPATEYVARFIGNYNVISRAALETLDFDIDLLPHSSMYALRPEAIATGSVDGSLSELPDYQSFIGNVTQITVLGSIIRMDVNVGAFHITVDTLHDIKQHGMQPGSAVRLQVPLSQWVPLNKSGT